MCNKTFNNLLLKEKFTCNLQHRYWFVYCPVHSPKAEAVETTNFQLICKRRVGPSRNFHTQVAYHAGKTLLKDN